MCVCVHIGMQKQSIERMLYIWAMRHPASGYVQGINDLVPPILFVFLSEHVDTSSVSATEIPEQIREDIEADTFWCLSHVLDGIQDHYTFGQPGIQREIENMKGLIRRIDVSLYEHLKMIGLEFMQFAFRWMNCLLVREMSLNNIIRMWDTYLAEGPNSFAEFHVYVCAAYLNRWGSLLKQMDFQDAMLFLQDLPSRTWDIKDVELLLSEAFMWKSMFQGTSSN